MSYVQIKLGEQERGLKFNQLAIELIAQYNDGATSSGFLYAMIYGGLRGNSYVKREEPNYTFEQVCDWVDAIEKSEKESVILKVTNALTETQVWKDIVSIETSNTEEEKKA